MKTKLLFLLITICCLSCKQGTKKQTSSTEDTLSATIDSTLLTAVKQYKFLAKQIDSGQYPKTYHAKEDRLETSNSGWWCSGFYPGTLLYLDEAVNAPDLKQEAQRVLEDLKKEQSNTSTHDLGFMMYCSFGNANRLEKNPEYEKILLNSAKSLSTRYNDTVKAIRSWDSAPWNKAGDDDLVVIIDNMMNLELLFWATKFSGDSTYYDIAVNHANTTIKNHFRSDYSSYHEVIYKEENGEARAKITNQGTADESAWARGQAWGLYGYTATYRETKDKKYLEQAQHIADFLINHPNMPKDYIPYWDFNAPGIPDALRDSSAASIIASALLELSSYSEGDKKENYQTIAKTILEKLLSDEYLPKVGENGGFILKHGVGNMPNKTEVDTPLSYGDYYLVEAMIRYKEMNQ
ncbi:glycoside hydrolase family 88 protein [Galbibacter sp. EGI 63066]|uniref:glycoside hydrolase family 88 protein n=1 Tax=Galbibacter sp. EGI 63066 TaxID=2993559 RepID=UPI00224964D4|nr:glycoside hydrolase family 88 protein [Galbibacter sp. EGI 63066]MCX2678482.1 glycoside hydrolase family 88 protein [Galbibacter sp. EGI 63066]